MAMAGPVSSKADIHDLADSTDLTGKRVFVRVRRALTHCFDVVSPPLKCSAQRQAVQGAAIFQFAIEPTIIISTSHSKLALFFSFSRR